MVQFVHIAMQNSVTIAVMGFLLVVSPVIGIMLVHNPKEEQ